MGVCVGGPRSLIMLTAGNGSCESHIHTPPLPYFWQSNPEITSPPYHILNLRLLTWTAFCLFTFSTLGMCNCRCSAQSYLILMWNLLFKLNHRITVSCTPQLSTELHLMSLYTSIPLDLIILKELLMLSGQFDVHQCWDGLGQNWVSYLRTCRSQGTRRTRDADIRLVLLRLRFSLASFPCLRGLNLKHRAEIRKCTEKYKCRGKNLHCTGWYKFLRKNQNYW